MKAEIYGTEWCAYCKRAISLCESRNIEYTYVDLDDSSKQAELEQRIGSRVKTVPQIFLDGEYIPGGFTGLKEKLG